MTVPCGFDNEQCASSCAKTGCNKTEADGVCNQYCNFTVCGLDFGDCGFCIGTCTSSLYYNTVCDKECDDPLCNYDNFQCVIYK